MSQTSKGKHMNTNKKQMIKQHIKLGILAYINRTAAMVTALVIVGVLVRYLP